MAKHEYQQVTDGEWWTTTLNNARIACCDCGLVHVVNSKVVFDKNKYDMLLIQQATVDEKETARLRKAKGVRIIKTRGKKNG